MRVLQRLHNIKFYDKKSLSTQHRLAKGFLNKEFGDDLLSHRNYTIIGAGLFHYPVRDGKEWDQTAMVAKHKLSNW